MKKFKKALVLFLCAVLLVAGSVMGTLAYLTSQDTVVNTFTVGNVQIKLDEAKVNTDGTFVSDHDNRVKANEYHLLPGHTYIKDPTVTVLAKSEDCYVRMLVKVDGLASLKAAMTDAKYYADDVFLLQSLTPDWDSANWIYKGFNENTDGSGVYEFRYKATVAKSDDDTKLPDLFQHIKVPGEINNDALAHLKDVTITVTAEAIQADGFDTADKAWTAFNAA